MGCHADWWLLCRAYIDRMIKDIESLLFMPSCLKDNITMDRKNDEWYN